MNKYARKNKLSKLKRQTIEHRLSQVEAELLTLRELTRPLILEQEAIGEARNKFIISCDASFKKEGEVNLASIGYVLRSAALPEPISGTRPTQADTSNSAELDAIYGALSLLPMSMHTHTITNDSRIKCIQIVSDSKAALAWIQGLDTPKDNLISKVKTLKDLIRDIELLTNKPVVLSWKARNSTADLIKANKLAQETLGVRNR